MTARRKSVTETELRPSRPSRRKLTVADLVLRRAEIDRRRRAREFKRIKNLITDAIGAIVDQRLTQRELRK
jgi:hypothetical protein